MTCLVLPSRDVDLEVSREVLRELGRFTEEFLCPSLDRLRPRPNGLKLKDDFVGRCRVDGGGGGRLRLRRRSSLDDGDGLRSSSLEEYLCLFWSE